MYIMFSFTEKLMVKLHRISHKDKEERQINTVRAEFAPTTPCLRGDG